MPVEVYGFDRAIKPVLVHEGGKVDHPRDPGGRTNQGVTQKVYNAWRLNGKLPIRDVYLMETPERDAIYRTQYWDAIKGDLLPEGVGYVVLDGAVHSGSKQSIKWLQRALGPLYDGKVDGVLGELTLEAVQSVNDYDALISRIIQRRMAFLQALKTWKTFGRGWSRRVADVLARGQAWATGSVGPVPTYIPGAEKKANIEDAKKPLPKAPGDVSTGVGGGGVVLGPILENVKDELTPLASKLPMVNGLIFWLIVAGAIVAVGGLAYRFFAANREKDLRDALDADVVG
jgi:lysozyme family protein